MHKLSITFSAVAILLFVSIPAGAQSPFAKAMASIFGDQYKGYQWLNYPIDNYGIGTMFEGEKASNEPGKVKNPNQEEFLCATFDCLELGAVPQPSLSLKKSDNPWLFVGKGDQYFADAGCGSDLTLKDFARKKKTVISAFLPQILKVVGVDFNYTNDDSITLNGTMVACDRRLLATPLATFLRNSSDRFGVRTAFDSRRLIVIKKDIVVQGMELDVASNSQLGTKLGATLGGDAKKIFGEGAKAGVEVSRTVTGNYKIKATRPLIVGVYAVRQPRTAGVGGSSRRFNIDTWGNTTIELPQ